MAVSCLGRNLDRNILERQALACTQAVRRNVSGPPIVFVCFPSTKEINGALVMPHRIFDHRSQNLSSWTELRKFRMKALQITINDVLCEKGVKRGKNSIVQPQSIEAEHSFFQQRRCSTLVKSLHI